MADYYSTPAQVREMMATLAALGMKATGVVVPAPAMPGPWPPVDPVEFEKEPADAVKMYALIFGALGDVEGHNVAALRKIASRPGWPPLMRAWELRGLIKGFVGLDEFRGELEQIPALKNAWEEKLSAILGGK